LEPDFTIPEQGFEGFKTYAISRLLHLHPFLFSKNPFKTPSKTVPGMVKMT
jgi:hypothetical protein